MSFAEDDFEFIAEPERPARGRVALHEESDADAVLVSNLGQLQKSAEETLTSLRQEFQRIASEREEIEQLKGELKKRIAQYDRLAEKQKAAIIDAAQQSERLSELRDEIVGELTALRKNRLSLEKDRALMATDHTKVERQLELLRQNRSQLEDRLDELCEIQQVRNRNTNLLDKLQVLDRFVDESEKELTRLRGLRQQIEEQVSRANVEYEQATALQVGSQSGALRLLDEATAYTCKECGTHIACESDVESKCYQVGQGSFTEKKRGFLFADACNLVLGEKKTETFTTGSYEISWVTCVKCSTSMGWKYLSSDNPSNASKIHKYCLSRFALLSPAERRD